MSSPWIGGVFSGSPPAFPAVAAPAAALPPGPAARAATGPRGTSPATAQSAAAIITATTVRARGFLHSFMARAAFKAWLQRLLRAQLQAALYAIVSSGGLIALCLLYRPIDREVYALEGGAVLLTRLLFYGGWALFAYCWLHLDLLEVVGLRPILRHHHGQGPGDGAFRPTGPFLWVRHPVELAFLIAFWST